MTCLIVGDHPVVKSLLNKMVSSVSYLEVAGECADAFGAIAFLQKQPVDLLIITDSMPDLSALDILSNLSLRPLAILISSKPEGAAEALDHMVADYLVEPFTPARFAAAILRAKEIFDGRSLAKSGAEKDAVFVRANNVLQKIRFDEILWVQALGDYVVFQMEDKKHVVHTKLHLVEKELPPGKFIHIHRSYIVALDKIKSVEKGNHITVNGHSLSIGQGYKAELLKRLNLL